MADSSKAAKNQPKSKRGSIKGIKGKRISYRTVTDNEEFRNTLSDAKNAIGARDRWRVDVHDADEYKRDLKIIADNGNGVVAVKPNGDIISVASTKNGDVRGSDLLRIAVANGGKKLDSFDGNFNFYVSNGFTPVSWTKFDPTYKPTGWSSRRDKPESVVFFKYTGSKTSKITAEEFYNSVKPSKNYDAAKRKRDRQM
ncbi:MAG: hypothetical protein PUF10_02750 [Bacteroidales bacterium]|nr:hypothetical protein [Bacteroidales bacterium]